MRKIIFFILMGFLSLLPPLRLLFVLSHTGDNNPLAEDILYVPIFHEVLQGTYPWKNFFYDTYQHAGHFVPFPVLIQILSAYFNDYNVYNIIYFGVVLSFFKLFLLYFTFTRLLKTSARIYLFPLLSLLCFSLSTLNTFEFDFGSLQMNLNHVGMALGVWGLVRYAGRWPGLFWMVFGGILASWSWGSGPLLWPAFLLGLLLLGFRRWIHYFVWLISGATAVFPYVYFIFTQHSSTAHFDLVSWFNVDFMIRAIGWPFGNLPEPFSYTYQKGIVGLMLLLIAVILIFLKRDRKMIVQATPGWILLAYSFTQFWLQGLVRGELSGWYTYLFMPFWMGLLDLIYVLWSNRKTSLEIKTRRKNLWSKWVSVYCGVTLLVLIGFYIHSNRDYRDKLYFMKGRSPISSSCLRHYATAPTYCEDAVVLWDVASMGNNSIGRILYQNLIQFFVFPQMLHMGRPLEKSHLSVFAPQQRWTLQGDFILDQVQIHSKTDLPRFFWTRDLTAEPTLFQDYEHLNLFLHSPNSVSWNLEIPQNIKKAVLHSAVAISTSTPQHVDADGLTFEVKAVRENGLEQVLFSRHLGPNERQWQPFEVSLLPFAGQKITLVFGSQPGKNNIHDWAMYHFPYIDLELDQKKKNIALQDFEWQPSNTDLNSLLSKPAKDDFVLDLQEDISSSWEFSNLDAEEIQNSSSQYWRATKASAFSYKPNSDLPLSHYTHLYFRMAAPANYYTGVLKVYLQVNHLSGYQRIFRIPLLSDGLLHTYTYDLKLLELEPDAILTRIDIEPLLVKPLEGRPRFYLPEIRFIRGEVSQL